MTARLVAKSLAGGHGHRVLFDDRDLSVGPGDVVGVVGANGAGKSTLLSLVSGASAPVRGSITMTPPDAFVGLLPQEHERIPGESVTAYLGRRTGSTEATAGMQRAADALGSGSAGAEERYAVALEHWLASGAPDLDERAEVALAEVGRDVATDTAMTALSGGQAARVALAALLLSRFDLVLLD